MASDREKGARELLTFYVEAGIKDAVGETAIDRFAELPPLSGPAEASEAPTSLAARAKPAATAPTAIAPGALAAHARLEKQPDDGFAQPPVLSSMGGNASPPLAPDAAVMAAREAAKDAANLDELRRILDAFEGCALKNTASRLVFADGDPKARIMFIGEAPGREEDIEGLPFVGRSGKLLDRMLATIGIERASAYIANIVPWRPPGNRTPTPQETAICFPFVMRQIELVNPELLVCIGVPSSQTLLGLKDGIRKIRGRWFPFQVAGHEIRAMPIYHPAYLLRSPLEKRWAWRDLLAIKAALAGN